MLKTLHLSDTKKDFYQALEHLIDKAKPDFDSVQNHIHKEKEANKKRLGMFGFFGGAKPINEEEIAKLNTMQTIAKF